VPFSPIAVPPIGSDELGRDAVSRDDARQLFTEHREAEALKAEKRAAAEARAIEVDQRWRAQLYGGIPASMIQEGVSPAAAMVAAADDAKPRRTSLLEDSLSRSGTTFRPIHSAPDEDAS
jgi:hypothetical protein